MVSIVFAELVRPTEIVAPPPTEIVGPQKGSFSKVGSTWKRDGFRWDLVLGRVWKYSDPGLLIRQIRYFALCVNTHIRAPVKMKLDKVVGGTEAAALQPRDILEHRRELHTVPVIHHRPLLPDRQCIVVRHVQLAHVGAHRQRRIVNHNGTLPCRRAVGTQLRPVFRYNFYNPTQSNTIQHNPTQSNTIQHNPTQSDTSQHKPTQSNPSQKNETKSPLPHVFFVIDS